MSIPKEERDYNSRLLDVRFYSAQNLDKQIVLINGGALILSMGFIEKIVIMSEGRLVWILIGSWCFFTISLVVNLFSHNQSINAVDARILGEDNEADINNRRTKCQNNFSILAMMLGMVFLIIFISINIL